MGKHMTLWCNARFCILFSSWIGCYLITYFYMFNAFEKKKKSACKESVNTGKRVKIIKQNIHLAVGVTDFLIWFWNSEMKLSSFHLLMK